MAGWLMEKRSLFSAALAGLLMGFGLVLGGLTRPQVVIGWVDVFGDWDPTLLVFFAGATGVYHLVFRWFRQRRPGLTLALSSARRIDAKLLIGSSVFGVGWALAGVCPGPALSTLGAGSPWALVFVIGMLLGLKLGGRQARASKLV